MKTRPQRRALAAERVRAAPAHLQPARVVSAAYSRQYVAYVIGLLSIVNVFNYVDRMALSVLAPSIQGDLALSDAQLGLLIGFAFAVFYAVCGIPIAQWADRGNRRNIIALALATWSVMTALTGAAQNFWQLFLARVGVGAGEGGGLTPAQSILCDYVPVQRRSGVFAIHTFGLYAGMMIGMVAAGALAERFGWRWTFVILGLPGIALALLVRLSLREPMRGFFDRAPERKSSGTALGAARFLWQCKTYRWLLGYSVVTGFVQYGLSQWWPSYYVREHGLSLASVGVYLGVALGVGSAAGLLIGGLLAHRTGQRDVRAPLVIGAIATLLALPVALASLFVRSASSSFVLVAFTGLLWSVSNGPVIAAMYSVTLPRLRATAGSVGNLFASILGFGLGPFCVGVLSDLLAPTFGAQALRYALIVPVSLLPLMVFFLYVASKRLPSDLRAAGAELEIISSDQSC